MLRDTSLVHAAVLCTTHNQATSRHSTADSPGCKQGSGYLQEFGSCSGLANPSVAEEMIPADALLEAPGRRIWGKIARRQGVQLPEAVQLLWLMNNDHSLPGKL